MVGLLTALPNTQLTRRLAERRAPVADRRGQGRPVQRRIELRHVAGTSRGAGGFPRHPAQRLRARRLLRAHAHGGRSLNKPRPPARFSPRLAWRELKALSRLLRGVTFHRTDLGRYLWSTVFDCLRHRPRNLEYLFAMAAFYLHLGGFARVLIENLDHQIDALDEAPQQTSRVEGGVVPLVRIRSDQSPSRGRQIRELS